MHSKVVVFAVIIVVIAIASFDVICRYFYLFQCYLLFVVVLIMYIFANIIVVVVIVVIIIANFKGVASANRTKLRWSWVIIIK